MPDDEITKDRLYRTLDDLLAAKEQIENDLKDNWHDFCTTNGGWWPE